MHTESASKEELESLSDSLSATIDMVNVLDGRLDFVEGQGDSISVVKTPCSSSKEIVLKIDNNFYGKIGNYLGKFSSGVVYKTNDGTNCKFKIVNNVLVQE